MSSCECAYVGVPHTTFQLFLQSGRAKDLAALYFWGVSRSLYRQLDLEDSSKLIIPMLKGQRPGALKLKPIG